MKIINAELVRELPLPRHENGDNKEGRGQILIVGGCLTVPGAILLSAEGAMRAGAGKLQIATCRRIAPSLGLAIPEAMVIGLPETANGCIAGDVGDDLRKYASRADAILVGPGVMDAKSMVPLVAEILRAGETRTGFVFDAGALGILHDCLDQLHQPGQQTIITPHSGEMAKLLDVSREAVDADPVGHAQQAAARFQCITVLKGGTTHVATPEGEVWVNRNGTIGLATSGSGDVLAGIIAGLMARGTPASEAAIWGVYLHAEAGCSLMQKYGGIGFLARELPAEIPMIIRQTSDPVPETH